MRYKVRDGEDQFTAITQGGVGLNFSGVERTQTYIKSYERLQSMQQGISVSLPNHAAMAGVFKRAKALANRQAGEPHPFVDAASYQRDLKKIIANAKIKLEKERNTTAVEPLKELAKAISD